MVNYSSIFPISGGGGSGGGFTEITTDTTLSVGGFFVGSSSSNVGVDVASVGTDQNIAGFNSGTGKLILHGLSSLGGVTAPTNKGAAIAPNTALWIKKTGVNTANVVAGTYAWDWIPGFEPTSVNLTYVSPGDTNGLFYWLGTSGLTTAFSNPVPSKMTASFHSPGGTISGTPSNLFDRSTGGQYIYFDGTSVNPPALIINLPNSFRIDKLAFKNPNDTTRPTSVKVRGWTAGSYASPNFEQTLTLTNATFNAWNVVDCSGFSPFLNYAIVLGASSNLDWYWRGSEVEFYGEYFG